MEVRKKENNNTFFENISVKSERNSFNELPEIMLDTDNGNTNCNNFEATRVDNASDSILVLKMEPNFDEQLYPISNSPVEYMQDIEIKTEENVNTMDMQSDKKENKLKEEFLFEIKTEPSDDLRIGEEIQNYESQVKIEPETMFWEPKKYEEKNMLSVKQEHRKSSETQEEHNKVYSCSVCNYKSNLKSSLTGHMKSHQGDSVSFFSMIKQTTSSKKKSITQLNQIDIETEEKHFACNRCEYTTVFKTNLIKHLRIHKKPPAKLYACQLCPNKYASKRTLKKHSFLHTFTCDLCELNCQNSDDLKIHKKSHEGKPIPTKDKYSCKLCKSTFKQYHHLENHLKTHSGEKPFVCQICSVKFTQKCSLKKHLLKHTGEKPFSCDSCPYKCTTNIDLIKHARIHTGERPYACSYCNYRSNTTYSLVTHMRGHTGEKPFSCKICHYKCSRSSELVRHTRTHTGEKRFSCNLCDYKCTRHCNLQSHMRVHSGELFSCDFCEYKTAHKSCVLVHIKKHMKEQVTGSVNT